MAPQDGEIEAGEMEHLLDRGVGQQPDQVGRVVAVAAEAHQMAVAVAGRQLHQAQPVAIGLQAHGLGVDRDDRPEVEPGRQVLLMSD